MCKRLFSQKKKEKRLLLLYLPKVDWLLCFNFFLLLVSFNARATADLLDIFAAHIRIQYTILSILVNEHSHRSVITEEASMLEIRIPRRTTAAPPARQKKRIFITFFLLRKIAICWWMLIYIHIHCVFEIYLINNTRYFLFRFYVEQNLIFFA